MSKHRCFTEFDFINWIKKTTPPPELHPLGIGDDCAILRTPANRKYVITSDSVLEGVHFKTGTSAYRIGWKAAGRSLSDIAAMGCRASAVTVSVVFTQGVERNFAYQMFRGLKALCARFDISLVGGDVSSWKGPLVVNCTATGDLVTQTAICRTNAKVGDTIFVSGKLGGSILKKHLHFVPRLALGEALSSRFRIHSMIDISDGLAADLGHILNGNSLGAILNKDNIPLSRAAYRYAKLTGKTPIEHALHDGEDYELLFTVNQNQAKRILQADLPDSVTPIGRIVSSPGLFLEERNGQRRGPIQLKGFEHPL